MSVAQRVEQYRERLRAQGLRPVQIWVPDTRREGFAEECRRQSRLLRDDPFEHEMSGWLEESADTEGWQ